MAVTSIWPIKGRVDTVIRYVRNPEKTTEGGYEALAALHAIDDVVEYAADDMKTERSSYVSCLNCEEHSAAQQFMETKRLWQGISGRDKLGGRVCFHGYQSFQADEVTAEQAHEIGVRLARELWGDRFEVVVATHCNTGHYHTHFVLNSVSFADGLKFVNTPADYARMREASDRLCREYAISVIEQPRGKAKHYAEWQAEQAGKPTHRGIIRADIDRAIRASTTERDFLRVMGEMGYTFKTRGKDGAPLKYPAIQPPDAGGWFRLHKLGEGYALEEIRTRILQNIHKRPLFEVAEHRPPPRRYRLRGRPRRKVTGLRALYFRYCYELRILTKRPASAKRVSFLLREDIAKMDRLDAETRLLGREHIGTIGDLTAYQERVTAEITALTAQRQELRKELRRLERQGDAATDEVRQRIGSISSHLKKLRKEVALCDGIVQRSEQVRENLERIQQQRKSEEKEMNEHELFRRRGGTGRAHDVRG